MKQAKIYYNQIEAGILWQEKNDAYFFEYQNNYFINPTYPAISKTFPKSQRVFASPILFPFFANLLSQEINLEFQCIALGIEPTNFLKFY